MAPRLSINLVLYRLSEARRPLLSQELLHHLLDDCLIHQVRLPAHIVELCGELYQLSHTGNGSSLSRILVAYDRLADRFGLRHWRSIVLKFLQCDEAALKFEAEPSRIAVLLCSRDVVEEACQSPSLKELIASLLNPRSEVLRDDGMAVAVDLRL